MPWSRSMSPCAKSSSVTMAAHSSAAAGRWATLEMSAHLSNICGSAQTSRPLGHPHSQAQSGFRGPPIATALPRCCPFASEILLFETGFKAQGPGMQATSSLRIANLQVQQQAGWRGATGLATALGGVSVGLGGGGIVAGERVPCNILVQSMSHLAQTRMIITKWK